jgi:uncharacterized protein
MSSTEWLYAGLGLAAGLGLLLTTVNRILSYLHGRAVKMLVAVVGVIVLPLGFAWLGYAGGRAGQVTVALVAFGLAIGELRRIMLRRAYRASPPVEQSGPAPALRRPITTTDLRLARYIVPLPQHNGASASAGRRLRIALLSDLHVNDQLPDAYFQEVIRRASQVEPDLVFITGDFVSSPALAQRLPGLLAGLRSRLGIFAVLGNHDYWAGDAQVRQVVSEAGITILGNGWQRIQADGLGNLLLLGCEEPWSRDRWQAPPVQDGDLVLALSHTADHIYRLSKLGTIAMFCGHYHAGQFRLPYLGAPFVPSRYGRRFCHGHFQVNRTHLFVTAGIGAAEPALRLYCPPDIFIVDLVA